MGLIGQGGSHHNSAVSFLIFPRCFNFTAEQPVLSLQLGFPTPTNIMKFSLASLSLLVLAPLAVFAQDDTIPVDAPVEGTLPEDDYGAPVELTKFGVEVIFTQHKGQPVPDLVNDKETLVKFQFTNNETFPVQVAAFGGTFMFPGKTEPYTNVSVVFFMSVQPSNLF